eukprot:gene1289-biopygen14150
MALFVQDDGMIVRPGIEEDEEIMAQDYVGAPWADAPANAELKRLVPTLVGNSGLSLRRVDACLDVTEPTTTPVHRMSGGGRLFNFNLQPEPEDVFFARSFSTIGCGCPTGVGERFAMEQRISSSKEEAKRVAKAIEQEEAKRVANAIEQEEAKRVEEAIEQEEAKRVANVLEQGHGLSNPNGLETLEGMRCSMANLLPTSVGQPRPIVENERAKKTSSGSG